jgi:arylamine N-acetyltransferase
MTEELVTQYLGILGIAQREPSYEALSEIVTAHLRRIPFENISKLYYMKQSGLCDIPGLEQYLGGIGRYNFGGTCYANNYYLNLLLKSLGYRAKLCGADMDQPDVHVVNMVTVDDREYIVDVGYTGPFERPIPRDLADDYEIVLGSDQYLFKPQDASGNTRLECYRDGVLRHGYLAKPVEREIEFFSDIIADSFSDDSTFMKSVLLRRCFPNRSLMLHNLTLSDSKGSSWQIHKLSGREELAPTIEKQFGIPRAIVAEAIAGLGELGDAGV